MPLEFVDMVKGFHPPSLGDRGFLINLVRARWNNSATTEAMNLLRTFAEPYYKMKCPEDSQEGESEQPEEASESPQKDTTTNGSKKGTKKSYRIQFAIREMVSSNTHGFLACNLADPADFAYYIFTQLAEKQDSSLCKLHFRIQPIQRICEAKARQVEETLLPLLEETLGKEMIPHRFSLVHRSYHSSGESPALSSTEVQNLARNCVWATNPNCVQCLKYQDYAVIMEGINPFLYIGVVRDYQKLAGYSTWAVLRRGLINTDNVIDSEDEISDDPTLSDEEERRRKLRLKRKRRAEKMGPETDEKEEEQTDVKEDGPDLGDDNDDENDKNDDTNDGGNLVNALNGDDD